MNKLKSKYSRIASDPSQITLFKNDVIDGKALVAAFAPSTVEEGKPYILSAVNGVISFVPNGWTPEPEEPEISGNMLTLSKYDEISDNAIVASDKMTIDASDHALSIL